MSIFGLNQTSTVPSCYNNLMFCIRKQPVISGVLSMAKMGWKLHGKFKIYPIIPGMSEIQVIYNQVKYKLHTFGKSQGS